ncbi:Akl1 serine/threonine protein kinase [Scheffersomyces amazonensis]|uniref:Akl1 serine/threonine protein kinase n=1 Tax=Scheffersomyces amazonensis TaxID=1078765 RepID=UPI00315D5C07
MGNFPKLPEGTELPVGTHKVTIVKYLSEGGFAHIYKVKIDPPEDDSDIACLKRVIVPDKAGLDLLRKEVDVMKILRHGRNIVKYYDSHAERLENGTYQVLVVMELCPNKSLLDYMNAKIKTRLNEREILKIMFDISLALYEMHRLKMIHRDVKIENVLIDSKHDFKLCDFGSTSPPVFPPKDQQAFQALSHDILYHTTPQYRAPEMIDLYRGWVIDEKADIWALGCFLFKLCYYTTPFEANGDIAILHASFQFPQTPIYSADLKNLIIIMLQESPLFRPNIFQVLILICTMSSIDFKSIKVEDIYHHGPYNFQALHNYQRQKQSELLKRQEAYYPHQAQSLGGSKNPSAVSLTNKQYDSSPITPNASQGAPIVSSMSQIDKNHLQIPQIADTTHIQGQVPVSVPVSVPVPVPSEGGSSRTASSSLHNEVVADPEPDADLDFDDSDDFADLNNVEERFPSLDDLLGEPVKDKTNKSEDGEPVNSTDINPPTQVSNEDEELKFPDITQLQVDPPHLTEENLKINRKKVVSEQIYDKKEAWMGLKSRMDKSAEQLVDDIFSNQSKSPLPEAPAQKTNQSSKSEVSSKKSVASEPEIQPSENIIDGQASESKLDNIDLIDLYATEPSVVKSSDQLHKVKEVVPSQVPLKDPNVTSFIPSRSISLNTSISNPFPYTPMDGSVSEAADSTANKRTSSSNPWGTFRAPSIQQYKVNNKEIPATVLPNQENFSMSELSAIKVPNPIPKENITIEPNLIDLEVGLDSSASSANTPVLQPRIHGQSQGLGQNQDIAAVESGISLLDLDLSEDSDIKQESKPFKKRISSIQNPANLNFEQEVIDFASDDENPDNGSTMNRLKIRNSLKKPKSRRSGEHKRNESIANEGKKRLSFFGGSSSTS